VQDSFQKLGLGGGAEFHYEWSCNRVVWMQNLRHNAKWSL